MLSFLGKIIYEIWAVSQIISGVTFGKSIPGSLEALEQGSVSTIERKWGKNTEEHIYMYDPFWTTAPKL